MQRPRNRLPIRASSPEQSNRDVKTAEQLAARNTGLCFAQIFDSIITCPLPIM